MFESPHRHQNLLKNQIPINPILSIQMLLDQDADPNASHEFKSSRQALTPLHRAVRMGRFDIVEALVSKGANLNTIVVGHTPLFYATRLHHWDIATLLLENGANPNEGRTNPDYLEFGTPLHYAIEAVPAEIDNNPRNATQNSAFQVAILLLEKGSEIDIFSKLKKGDRYLTEASRCQSVYLLDLLINKYRASPLAISKFVHKGDAPLTISQRNIAKRARLINFYCKLHQGESARKTDDIEKSRDHFYQAAQYPDLFFDRVLKPLILHRTNPTQYLLSHPNQIRLLREMGPRDPEDLLQLLITIPAARATVLRTQDPGFIAILLNMANESKVKLDLKENRKLHRHAITLAEQTKPDNTQDQTRLQTIAEMLRPEQDKLNPNNDINRQIMDLTFYFKKWRLDNASTSVRFFKSKKMNSQRQQQLDLHSQYDLTRLSAIWATTFIFSGISILMNGIKDKLISDENEGNHLPIHRY